MSRKGDKRKFVVSVGSMVFEIAAASKEEAVSEVRKYLYSPYNPHGIPIGKCRVELKAALDGALGQANGHDDAAGSCPPKREGA